MDPSITTSTTEQTNLEDIQLCNGHTSNGNQENDPSNGNLDANVPLLLQPSYARSRSVIFDELRSFRISLKWCALDHSSCVGKLVSYSAFALFTLVIPIISSLSVELPSSSEETISFNKLVQLPESCLALIAFFTLVRFFRKYGLRQLLFLDALQDDATFVRRGYSRELDKAFRFLAYILLPSFFVELAHKIVFFENVTVSLPHINPSVALSSILFVLVLGSWVYRTGVFLLVCVLFRLTCELQILRLEGLHKMFEGSESDAGVIFGEHVRIKKQLSCTSHRYRFFIIACLLTITVSQLGALLLVLAFKTENSFLNYGDLLVCSAVELSGFFICILGAARITHRAQGIVSVASRWTMVMTSSSARLEQHGIKLSHSSPMGVLDVDGSSETDTHSSDISIRNSSQDPSSFQTRQALVGYLQHNYGGITLFGFALDRGLLHTIFAFEFSLVLWILSKVVVLS